MKPDSDLLTKVRRKLKYLSRKFSLNKNPKIFCISLQRTGTTSTGRFFSDHAYSVATYQVSTANAWTANYFKGNYEYIFKSKDFKNSQVFEDDPWWLGDFYKVLYHQFPSAKFILLERDADKWFESMMAHSRGRTLGNTHIHTTQYQRLYEFYNSIEFDKNMYTGVVDNALPLNEAHRTHYTNFYKIRNSEIKQFFLHHDNRRLFAARLEDEELWKKMGRFFKIEVRQDYNIHLNKTSK